MGRASSEDIRSDHSPPRRLPTSSELWSGLRPPDEETQLEATSDRFDAAADTTTGDQNAIMAL